MTTEWQDFLLQFTIISCHFNSRHSQIKINICDMQKSYQLGIKKSSTLA